MRESPATDRPGAAMYLTLNRASRARPLHPALNGASAIGQLFDGFLYSTPASASAPANGASTVAARFDVVEKDDRFEARIEMPGVAKDDIDVQIDGATVRVKADVKAVEPVDGAKVLHSNRVTR